MHHDGDLLSLTLCKFITTDGLRVVMIEGNHRTNLTKNVLGNSDLEFFQFGLTIIPN